MRHMAIDILERAHDYEIMMDLPGFNKEDIQVDYENGYLTISAKREEEHGRFLRQERYTGSYERSFYIGKYLNENDIHAAYKNGVLIITIPKYETQKGITII